MQGNYYSRKSVFNYVYLYYYFMNQGFKSSTCFMSFIHLRLRFCYIEFGNPSTAGHCFGIGVLDTATGQGSVIMIMPLFFIFCDCH